MTGRELAALHDELGQRFPPEDVADVACTALALTVGATEGAVSTIGRLRDEEAAKAFLRDPAKPKKEVAELLALAGVLQPPDRDASEREIQQVVAMARANRARLEIGSRRAIEFFDLDELAEMATVLLGVNKGEDAIREVRVADVGGDDYEVHAFDAAGYHVLDLSCSMAAPGVLEIESLQASHGRNCESLTMAFGGPSVPGRGNAAAVAAGLSEVIVKGSAAGLHAIQTIPGSPQVQRLYEKMGFTTPGDSRPWRRKLVAWSAQKLPVVSGVMNVTDMLLRSLKRPTHDELVMTLDLTNEDAVRQALVAFGLTRAAVKDVPKGVADRIAASGAEVKPPSVERYRREFPEGPGVRVLT